MSHSRLDLAEHLAGEVGKLAQKLRADPSGLEVSSKGTQDFVTAADIAVETRIREVLTRAFPDDAILGEEGGLTGDGKGCWIIDPIDGTTNYMRGGPDWAISIGYFNGEEISLGVIYAPDHNAMLTGSTEDPARLNGKPVRVSDRTEVSESLVQIGYSKRLPLAGHLALIERLLSANCEYRRLGTATTAMMSVASGQSEAYFEANLNIWDAAAGVAIVRAAGGWASHPALPDFLHTPGPVAITNGVPAIYDLCARSDA